MSSLETKICHNCKNPFTIEPEDFLFYDKMHVPAPMLCPECRFKRRAQFRNETALYSRTCDLCKRSVISMYNPKSPYTVYCPKCWEGDAWDRNAYAQAYDVSRPFFEQLGELFCRVPKMATFISTSGSLGPNVNSDYTNVAGGNKNCYLVFNAGANEDTMYSRGIKNCRDTLDAYYGSNLERCYEVINTQKSSGVIYGHNVMGTMDSVFMLNASGCQSCFGCVNLRHKSYHFFNEPLSKEEYQKRVDEIRGSYARMREARERFEKFALQFPHRQNSNLKTVDSTGDYLFESKNLSHCFEADRCEDCKYLFSVKLAKDSYDCMGFGYDSQLLLEGVGVGYASRVIGSYAVEDSQNVLYSFMVRKSHDCVGCDAIRSTAYCILNKRYDEKTYGELKARIVDELTHGNLHGLCMPPEIAPFAYNETVAQDNMPLTKEEAIAQGFRWEDDVQMTKGKETMKPEHIPDHIRDVSDAIVQEILACVSCSRNYRVIEPELAFYRQMVLPLPRQCFFCRHHDRIRRRGPLTLYMRPCAKCDKHIQTSYAPDRPEIVYCEQCYQQEVA